MKKIKIKDWELLIDPEQTRQILKNVESGAETCKCSYCCNFIAARSRSFPKEFLDILEKLGIDFNKDVQVSEISKVENGLHLYNIVYYFIGKVVTAGTGDGEVIDEYLKFYISDKILYRTNEFPKDILEIRCYQKLPWIIEGKEEW